MQPFWLRICACGLRLLAAQAPTSDMNIWTWFGLNVFVVAFLYYDDEITILEWKPHDKQNATIAIHETATVMQNSKIGLIVSQWPMRTNRTKLIWQCFMNIVTALENPLINSLNWLFIHQLEHYMCVFSILTKFGSWTRYLRAINA